MKKHTSVPVGLGALLARLASLSKLQTAALCVALAAVPVGWQWREHRQAEVAVQRMRAQLLAAQTNGANTRADLDQLRVDSTKLEQSLAQANEAVARAADSAQAFAAWKEETRGLPAAADHGWLDESPFVRISKAILPELGALTKVPPFAPPGVVNPHARELLGLTREERQAIGKILQPVAEMQRGEKADVYETEGPVSGRTIVSRVFATQPPGKTGPEAEQRFARMLEDLHDILGDERWPVVPSRYRTVNCDVLNRMFIPEPATKVFASVETDTDGIPQAKWTYNGEVVPAPRNSIPTSDNAPAGNGTSGNAPKGNVYSLNVVGYMNGSAALSSFLPGGDAHQTTDVARRVGSYAPEVLRRRATAWLQEQAVAQMGEKEKR